LARGGATTIVRPMRRRRFALVAGALAATLSAKAASGKEGPAVALQLDCPELDEETRAVLEARARAELASEPLPPGALTIRCGARSATLTWHPVGSEPRERTARLDGVGDVDSVLEGMHDLCAPETRTAPGASEAVAKPARVPPPPAPPADERRASAAPAARLAAVANVDAELWQGGISVALGVSGGARLRIGRWRATFLLEPERGIGSAMGVSAWGLRGVAQVDYAVTASWLFGVGITGRALWAQAATSTPTQQEGTTAGAVVAVRYALPLGDFELSVGPSAEALLSPIVVRVDQAEAFRVPTFVVGAAVEASFPGAR
jgi:hypothetical protein